MHTLLWLDRLSDDDRLYSMQKDYRLNKNPECRLVSYFLSGNQKSIHTRPNAIVSKIYKQLKLP